MRTTDVRKLRPEAWGFICPVHTPDGAPCGLLNHVTASCRIVTHYPDTKLLNRTLSELGVVPHASIELMNTEAVCSFVISFHSFFVLRLIQFLSKETFSGTFYGLKRLT